MEVESPQLEFPDVVLLQLRRHRMRERNPGHARHAFLRHRRHRNHVPVVRCRCARACRRTMRRRPPGFFSALLVLGDRDAAWSSAACSCWATVALPLWMRDTCSRSAWCWRDCDGRVLSPAPREAAEDQLLSTGAHQEGETCRFAAHDRRGAGGFHETGIHQSGLSQCCSWTRTRKRSRPDTSPW